MRRTVLHILSHRIEVGKKTNLLKDDILLRCDNFVTLTPLKDVSTPFTKSFLNPKQNTPFLRCDHLQPLTDDALYIAN